MQVAPRTVAILNFWQTVKYIWDTGVKAFQPTKNYKNRTALLVDDFAWFSPRQALL